MGFIFGIIKRLLKLIIFFGIFFAAIVLIPNLPPYTTFSSIKLEPTQEIGSLVPNVEMKNAEKLFKGKIQGPEAFKIYKGDLYTSLGTGEVMKISPGGHITFVTKIGQPCTGISQERICGRPLGFDIDEKNNQLYVVDAYYGIWKVDLKTDKKQLLVSPQVEINGHKPKLFNFIALHKNGDFFWTHSSTDFDLQDGAFTALADPSGRLLHYNAAKNESKVLLDNMWFTNGLVISSDNQFVVVSESLAYRLVKYYIDGPKKGKSEVFVSGLPGAPDNLRPLPDGSGFLVAIYTLFDADHPMITKSLAETPLVRKFLARIQRLIEIPFEFLNSQYPHILFDDIIYYIGHFKSVSGMSPHQSGLLQIDWNGKIIASYYNVDKSLSHISDAIVYNDKLYLGAPHSQDYIGSVAAPTLLKNAFSSPKSASAKIETPKPKAEVKPEVKPAEKPKVQEKPKVEKEVPKGAKPVAHEKPKVSPPAKPTPPSTTAPPPTTTPAPKTSPPPKPAEPVKTTTQKPTTKPVETKKAAPLPAQTKPKVESTQPPKQTTPPPVQSKEAKPTPKPEVKPKSVDAKPKSEQPADKKPTQTKPKNQAKEESQKPVPKQIPIEEEIPSDTIKPSKETLKVIKKGGPTEIPNPNL